MKDSLGISRTAAKKSSTAKEQRIKIIGRRERWNKKFANERKKRLRYLISIYIYIYELALCGGAVNWPRGTTAMHALHIPCTRDSRTAAQALPNTTMHAILEGVMERVGARAVALSATWWWCWWWRNTRRGSRGPPTTGEDCEKERERESASARKKKRERRWPWRCGGGGGGRRLHPRRCVLFDSPVGRWTRASYDRRLSLPLAGSYSSHTFTTISSPRSVI